MRVAGASARACATTRASPGHRRLCAPSRPCASTPTSRPPASAAAGPSRRVATRATPIDLSSLTQEQIYAGSAVLAGLLGLAAAAAASAGGHFSMMGGGAQAADAAAAAAEAEQQATPLPREDAVLVLGGTGKLGRRIVDKLVRAGRTVVVAARSADKAGEVFAEAGLQEGYQSEDDGGSGSGGILIVEGGVDVTLPDSLTAELFRGVTQVVSALGPVAGRLPEGGFGYIDDMTPERVEAQGMANIIAAIKAHAPQLAATIQTGPAHPAADTILPMRTAEELEAWERLDDVIMGGGSSSGLAPAEDGSGAVWKGDLIVEGGGFCGSRTRPLNLDLSRYDGLQLRVRGDGQIFKFNIKTAEQEDTPEHTYQATFDTSPEGDWTTVRLPWHNFVPVKRAQSDPSEGPLDGSSISKLGLVLSRFEFNKMPNPSYKPGPFTLQIEGGICAYKAPRPAVVAISSAGVERNAIIGDDAEARKRDIPIVQLNPGGVLNWKYAAECELRASGLPYTIIRCTGLDDRSIAGPALLEADQGDAISGKLSRDEAAQAVAAALARPDAAGKTLELRQSEAADAQGRSMSEAAFTRLFLKLALDRNRWRVGLLPFPRAMPPPPPPSEDRTKEILADPRVQAARQRDTAAAQDGQQQEAAQEQEQGEQPARQEAQKEKELVNASA